MNRQILKNATKVFIIFFKLIVLIIMFGCFAIDFIICAEASTFSLFLYGGLMMFCLTSFVCTMFIRIRKISYLLFIIGIALYSQSTMFLPEIRKLQDESFCIETGKVWDKKQQICRDDCLKWDDKLGCIKNYEPDYNRPPFKK